LQAKEEHFGGEVRHEGDKIPLGKPPKGDQIVF